MPLIRRRLFSPLIFDAFVTLFFSLRGAMLCYCCFDYAIWLLLSPQRHCYAFISLFRDKANMLMLIMPCYALLDD